MQLFIQRHVAKIRGVLSGFDRLVFRGTLRSISYVKGMMSYLWHMQVPLTEFGDFVHKASTDVISASCHVAESQGRPVEYLPSPETRKEGRAREIARKDGVTDGLICVLKAVEPCMTFEVFKNREKAQIELRPKRGKCLHLYHYLIHPTFGFMHVRLQTWFPFAVQVWINGREWLARDLDRAGIAYQKCDNAFPDIADFELAQHIMDRQLDLNWPRQLARLALQVHPLHPHIFGGFPAEYTWSVHQSEWATDLAFTSPQALASIYPQLLLHGITLFGSTDVIRFLGRKVNGNFLGEVVSDFKNRPEGARIKHWVGRNNVKLYDKLGRILRTETTINDPRGIRVFRAAQGASSSQKAWRPMRKGVADIRRRTQVSQAANDRYLDALAAADTSQTLGDLLTSVTRRGAFGGRPVRGLRPWSADDVALMSAIADGASCLRGFSNRDIRQRLYAPPNTKDLARRQGAKVSRLLRLLSLLWGHGLIRMLGPSRRYTLTSKGRLVCAATLAAQRATIAQLQPAA